MLRDELKSEQASHSLRMADVCREMEEIRQRVCPQTPHVPKPCHPPPQVLRTTAEAEDMRAQLQAKDEQLMRTNVRAGDRPMAALLDVR